jgi:hypothetical protein
MTYWNEARSRVVMRDAASLTGPWSGEKSLTPPTPGLYGPYIYPMSNATADVYFNVSNWSSYNVSVMHAPLGDDGRALNLASDPGFEEYATQSVPPPPGEQFAPNDAWLTIGTGGVDVNANNAASGLDNGWVRATSGWNAIGQILAVRPNTWYTLSASIRTSASFGTGYLSAWSFANNATGSLIHETAYGPLTRYQRVSTQFYSGANTSVFIDTGFWGNGSDQWVQIDDVSVVPL